MRKKNTSQLKEIIIDNSSKNKQSISINTVDIGIGTSKNKNEDEIERRRYEIAYIEVRKIHTSNAKPLLLICMYEIVKTIKKYIVVVHL